MWPVELQSGEKGLEASPKADPVGAIYLAGGLLETNVECWDVWAR